MSWVLLVGVVLNLGGAAKLLASAVSTIRATPPSVGVPDDHLQLQLFVAGTAATFGGIYAYLYGHQTEVDAILPFGAALKTWALILCTGLLAAGRLSRRTFVEFGVTNGIVAVLFWTYLATSP